jgi:DNA-binding transcriptional LysR family regulator
MDIVLLKTFLEVARMRHFGKAAEVLCVTQSAVSARIKLLETTLGVDLFSRKRNDIQLTAAGHGLRRHAETIVRSWARASQEVALGKRFSQALAVGSQADLWSICVREWLPRLRAARPDLALQVELLSADLLVQRLIADQLDLIFLFEPPCSSELMLEAVLRVPLVMVCDQPGISVKAAMEQGYVLVDWGTSFMISHSEQFPDARAPSLRVSHGGMALDVLRREGGAAYLARQMAKGFIERGMLHPVSGAPVIERQAYVAYRPDSGNWKLIQEVLRLACT